MGLFDVLSEAQLATPPRRMGPWRIWRILISIVLSVLFLFIVVRDLDWHAFLSALKNTQQITSFYSAVPFELGSLHGFMRTSQLIGLTSLMWLMDALGVIMLAYVLRIPLLLQQAFIFWAALDFFSAIPSTPGYLGVYQFVAIMTMALFGISQAEALVFILISQILGLLVTGFWGIFSLWRFNGRGLL